MVRMIAEQSRPLLVAWLLVALPVVCHNQTAIVVLGALTAGHAHPHSTVVPTSPHGSHTAASASSAHAPQAPGHHQPSTGQHEWCADHSIVHTHGLPEGQDGVGLIGALAWVRVDSPIEPLVRLQPPRPDATAAAPPSPPPRSRG